MGWINVLLRYTLLNRALTADKEVSYVTNSFINSAKTHQKLYSKPPKPEKRWDWRDFLNRNEEMKSENVALLGKLIHDYHKKVILFKNLTLKSTIGYSSLYLLLMGNYKECVGSWEILNNGSLTSDWSRILSPTQSPHYCFHLCLVSYINSVNKYYFWLYAAKSHKNSHCVLQTILPA